MDEVEIDSINTILDDISKYIKIAKGSEYTISRNSNNRERFLCNEGDK